MTPSREEAATESATVQSMADVIRPELLREGRDPDWRLGWEEHLSSDARSSVVLAVKNAQRVQEPGLRIYAEGLARRRLRSSRWSMAFAPFHVALVGVWIYATCVLADPPQPWCWFYIALGLVWLSVVPIVALRRRRNLESAVAANSDSAA